MKCIYCGTEMEVSEHDITSGIETHWYSCTNCNAECRQREDADDLWEEPEPCCDYCGEYMELDTELDNGVLVFLCGQCNFTTVIEPTFRP